MPDTPNFTDEEKNVLGYFQQAGELAISFVLEKDTPGLQKSTPEMVVISKYLETEDRVFYRLVSTQMVESTDGLKATLHAISGAIQRPPGASLVEMPDKKILGPTGKPS